MNPLLILDSVTFRINKKVLLTEISFRLAEGKIACILGPSGCGKTTLLRAIAGFCSLSSGSIEFAGSTIATGKSVLPPEQRHIGFVFQDNALFPHLTVRKNVAFGLAALSSLERCERVDYLLELISLKSKADKYPHQLSGGEQQRVALARALAPKPRLILLDEPFSSLDSELRETLAFELRSLLNRENTTAIMVTHDINEAFALADEIGVMSEGVLQQWGSTQDLYDKPQNRFVAEFITQGSFLPGELVITESGHTISTELGSVEVPQDTGYEYSRAENSEKVDVLITAANLKLDPESEYKVEIVEKYFRGSHLLYRVKLVGTVSNEGGSKKNNTLPLLADKQDDLALKSLVGVRIDIKKLIFFVAK